MNDPIRLTIAIVGTAVISSALTAYVMRVKYKQDLEFLGIANQYVEDGLAALRNELGDDEDD